MEGGTGKGAIFLCQIFIRVNPVHLWFKSSSTTDAHRCTQMESGKPFSRQPSRDYCGSERRVGATHAWHRRKTENYGKINRMKSGTGKGARFPYHILFRVNPVHLWFKSSSTTDAHRCTQMESGKPLSASFPCLPILSVGLVFKVSGPHAMTGARRSSGSGEAAPVVAKAFSGPRKERSNPVLSGSQRYDYLGNKSNADATHAWHRRKAENYKGI